MKDLICCDLPSLLFMIIMNNVTKVNKETKKKRHSETVTETLSIGRQ